MGRVPEIVQRVQPSVVTVLTDRGEGSGVVYRPGTIVTNHHVVAGAEPVKQFETRVQVFFCASLLMVGLLIQATVGSLGGAGRRLQNRWGSAV